MIKSDELHKLYYGSQDEYLETQFPKDKYVFDGKYISTETFTLSCDDITKPIIIQLQNTSFEKYGYSNIQLLDKYCSMIKSITLEVGGSQVNRIYPSITGNNVILSFADENTILPKTKYHGITIFVNFLHPGTVEITADLMEINNFPNENLPCVAVLLNQTLHNGKNELTEGINKIPMWFNHPIKKITIIADENIDDDVTLVIGCNMDGCPYEFNGSFHEKKCAYEFENTINFSRIETPYLLVHCKQPNGIHIFAEALHAMKLNNDMCGMAFSK